MMTETTKTNKPTTKTFRKAFNNVVLFPFRAVKFLVKWGFKVVLAILILFTLLYTLNAALPMAVPEAQGITTAQLYADRFKAVVELTKNKDYHPLWLVPMVVIIPAGYFMGPIEVVLCAYFPDGKFEKWVRKSVIIGKEYYRFVPSLEPTLANLSKIIKENFDHYTWYMLVTLPHRQFPYPQLPTNK